MNVYVDASALVKAFVREAGHDEVVTLLEGASIVATSILGYVECRSAVARLAREGYLSRAAERRAVQELDGRWEAIARVELDDGIRREAGHLTHRYALRASDAVHLASALSIADSPSEFQFACWDARLWDAAAAAGFQMVPTTRP